MSDNIPDKEVPDYIKQAAEKLYPAVKPREVIKHPNMLPSDNYAQLDKQDAFISGVMSPEALRYHQSPDEIIKLKNLLVKYEQWEADIISNDEVWWPSKAKDSLPEEIYNKMLELQGERNELLKRFTPESYEQPSSLIQPPVWVKAVPNKEGYWLRINAIGRPQIHFIRYFNRGEGDKLFIEWGWGGDTKFQEVDKIKHNLEAFYWMFFSLPAVVPEQPSSLREGGGD